MVKLNLKNLLKESKHTKYWLVQQTGSSYQTINKMVNNETKSIRFETLNRLCEIFNCEIGDIIVRKKGKKKNKNRGKIKYE